jgi:DNA-directed RNA polymerase subunit RPC12/RpoP
MEITVIIKCPRCRNIVAESFEEMTANRPYIFCTSCNLILPLKRKPSRNMNTERPQRPIQQTPKLLGEK